VSGPKQRMSMRDAMEIVDDDLPDGAYWAMCHEVAGLEYGDGFDELVDEGEHRPGPAAFKCSKKLRAKVEKFGTLIQHDTYHWTVRVAGKVIAEWWPHKRQWRIDGKIEKGDPQQFIKALAARKQ
jgi:hypothetical protein